MRKTVLTLLWLTLLSATAGAATVPVKVAGRLAARLTGSEVNQVSLPADIQGMYLFVGEGGYAVIAADDCVRPVLAYGSRWCGPNDTLPAAIHDWLQAYGDEIADRIQRKVEPSEATRFEWLQLMNAPQGPEPLFSVVVSPLLTTTWNQSPRYNNLCPSGCVTGCVATATAQVMKYWNHPAQGTGSHSYTDGSHGTLSANFGTTTYQWSLMPNALTGASSSSQINAVATLMYHIGVAVEMAYGSSSSATTGSYGEPSSFCAENALKTYFGYSQTAHHVLRASMSDSLWCAIIDEELSASRPILYSGRDVDGGHAFVLDGSNAAGHYHFNWGWGGYCDGYYLMGQLNPSPGGTGGTYSSTYNLSNTAVMGIRPASTATPTTCAVNVTLTDAAHATVTGAGNRSYGDTVTVKVNTNAGYRFTRWSDGVHFNPRRMVVDSAVNLTAIVEPINATDTVYYCNTAYQTSFGVGGAIYWGIRLYPADIERFSRLSKVLVYDGEDGLYQLRIYKGGYSSPNTLIYTQNVTFTETDDWREVTLDSALSVDASMPLWVTFYTSDASYPAAASTYGGHASGAMLSSSGSNWHTLSYTEYSFMIRAIFQSAQYFDVTAGGEHGTVEGTGQYVEGTEVTLTARPDPCYVFSVWSDGVTDNPRTFTLTGDIALTALFEETSLVEELDIHACDSFSWHGNTYTVSTVDSVMSTSYQGCDSSTVLRLTLDYSVDGGEVYDTAVAPYIWNNTYYDQSGDYTFVGQTAEGCDSTVVLHLVIVPAQGIDGVDATPITLYPNPTASVVTLEGVPCGTEVILYSAEGRELLRQTVLADRQPIDVSLLPAGSYLLSVSGRTYRFVKQ